MFSDQWLFFLQTPANGVLFGINHSIFSFFAVPERNQSDHRSLLVRFFALKSKMAADKLAGWTDAGNVVVVSSGRKVWFLA